MSLPSSSQERIDQIFLAATELPAEQRADFVRDRCGSDSSLRNAVQALLAAEAAADDAAFLESAFVADPDLLTAGRDLDSNRPRSVQPDSVSARFEIRAKHDHGGLGEVFIAYDRQLKREVAIKQIRPKWRSHEEARQRFVREAEVTGRLEHPGIVPVYAMGTWDDGRDYYAMRFIHGQTLKQVIDDHHSATIEFDRHESSLALRGLLNRFVDVCNTVSYAHSREILHRDIKPSNIMIGPYGETLLVDWGLAKLLDQPQDESVESELDAAGSSGSGSTPTIAGQTFGTPQYMSPEQASGALDQIGVRTDVYLLGATLYQILTGQPPHRQESVSKLVTQVQAGTLRRPTEVNAVVPPALEAICLHAMSFDQSSRYPSAADLAADVERWLADEPVSVYADPIPVRLGRWSRHHRMLVSGGAVAAGLIVVGSVLGSAVWNHQQTRQLRLERERNLKESELLANQQQRLIELRSSARTAASLSEEEIRASRFSSAHQILSNASRSLVDEPSLSNDYQTLNAKAKRIGRIVDFYQDAESIQQHFVAGEDVPALTVGAAGMHALGIWDKPDWWNHLPDDDLTPRQQDQLLWDVYHHWLMLDAILTKTIGIKTLAGDAKQKDQSVLAVMRRFLQSDLGKPEARAVRNISDRIAMFRRSEAARWFGSVADFRLNGRPLIPGSELEPARNAADAQQLGILCLIAAVQPNFQAFFHNYHHADAYTAAKELFQRSSSLRPDQYWTQLSLATTQLLTAGAGTDPTWRDYEQAIQTVGRCIAIDPQKCMGYADRCAMLIMQSRLVAADPALDPVDRQQRIQNMLRTALQDARVAQRSRRAEPWVQWQLGLALHEVGQAAEALAAFEQASVSTLMFQDVRDFGFLEIDDLRGRDEVADIVQRLAEQHPRDSKYLSLLASVRLNQHRSQDALDTANLAIALPDATTHAYAVRGMAHLRQQQLDLAAQDFRQALSDEADHIWAVFGLAVCDEQAGRWHAANDGFQRANELANNVQHRSASLLCASRVLGYLGYYDQAKSLIHRAIEIEPACDLSKVARPLTNHLVVMNDSNESAKLQPFLEFLSQLPQAYDLEFANDPRQATAYSAPLLNGGFELGSWKYWSDAWGATWRNEAGYQSQATVSSQHAHWGKYSLFIHGAACTNSEQRGVTEQIFPVPRHKTYTISCWAKAQGLEPAALRLESDAGQQLVTLPAGDYDWTRFEAEIDLGSAQHDSMIIPFRLQIVSAGPGQIWLDDVRVVVQ
jgi:serine/threonine protein kinase